MKVPILTQKLQNKVPKTPFTSILSLYAVLTSRKKPGKFHALTFDNTWKTSISGPNIFLPSGGVRLPKHGQMRRDTKKGGHTKGEMENVGKKKIALQK